MRVSQLEIMKENARAFQSVSVKSVEVYKGLGDVDTIQHNSVLVVTATNLMFSIELHFKAAILFITGKFEKGHKVYDLFSKLPEAVQKEINAIYENLKNIAPAKAEPWVLFTAMDGQQPSRGILDEYKSDLVSLLKAHDGGFIKWRYSYEISNPILIFDYYNLLMLASSIEMAMTNEMSKLVNNTK